MKDIKDVRYHRDSRHDARLEESKYYREQAEQSEEEKEMEEEAQDMFDDMNELLDATCEQSEVKNER